MTSPVLVAIDDAHWLDASSARTMDFALRRVDDVPVAVLASRRPGAQEAARANLVNVFARAQQLTVGGLSLGATHELLKRRLGRSLPRPLLVRVHQTARGNPFYTLEIARAAIEIGVGPGEPLPVPDDLLQLVVRRVRRLGTETREALLVAAAAARPSLAVVSAALGADAAAALDDAEQAGIVDVSGDEIRFSHPLYASAVYSSTPRRRRQAVHGRLAEVAIDTEERARQLALGTRAPDENVAASLEDAAVRAASRAALAAALELMELACRLTPPEAVHATLSRRIELADLANRAGDADRAQELLEEVIAAAEPGLLRARACVLLAAILHTAGTPARAAELSWAALGEASDDTELLARIHMTLAAVDYEDFRQGAQHARVALGLLDSLDDPDPALYSQALSAHCGFEIEGGRQLPADAVERALALEERRRPAVVADRFSAALGVWLKYLDDFDGARHWFELTYQRALDEGDVGSLPYALSHLPQIEIWSGNWGRAEETARRHLQLAEETAQEAQRRLAVFNLAFVHAHQGRVPEARVEIAENLAAAAQDDDTWTTWISLAVLGHLEFSLGDPAEAVRQFERAAEIRDAIGDGTRSWFEPDFVEGLTAIGELERAGVILDRYEARARAVERHSALANAARCRALLAAARGDLDDAAAALDAALAEHDAVPIPLDHGRTLLAKGQIERRARRKAGAKESLQRAREIFDRLASPLWVSKAEGELARVGLRRAAPDELTETERRVAELAASGLTNREVASQLFMSPKTVEANLARAYRKLDIRSRAELGARLADGQRVPGQT